MGNVYKDVYLPEHPRARKNSGNVSRHILIAEESLGRPLREGEVVHHEDEDRTNNSPENLYVFINQEHHARYHMTGKREKVEDYWVSYPRLITCKGCSKEFEANRKEAKYCSRQCFHKTSSAQGFKNKGKRSPSTCVLITSRPPKEELYKLLTENPFTKVGKMFGVSDNAVRKWCKAYGMSTKSKDYK